VSYYDPFQKDDDNGELLVHTMMLLAGLFVLWATWHTLAG